MNADQISAMWAGLGATGRVLPGDYRVYESSLQTSYGPILVGLDTQSFRHLLIPIARGASIPEDRRSRGVQIRAHTLMDEGEARSFVDVVCIRPDLNSLFDVLVAEMMDAIAANEAPSPIACRIVLDRWRDLLAREQGTLLSGAALAALFGELLWLQEIVEADPNGLSTWKGPTRGRHDFVRGSIALEVKTSQARSGRFAEIHGHDQLEPPPNGALFLAFMRLQEDATGIAVPDLVRAILKAGVDEQGFVSLLGSANYDLRDTEAYARVRFSVSERRLYSVDELFPKITSQSFGSGHMPQGTLRLTYVIDLSNEPPLPLSHDAAKKIGEMLASEGAC